MNWITNYVRPKINSMLGRRDMPENLWIKDPESGEMVFHKDLEEQPVRHPLVRPPHEDFGQGAAEVLLRQWRVRCSLENPKVAIDPLKFRDEKRYTDRLKDARTKTGLEDAILNGAGTIEGLPIVATVQDFAFMGGSLGMAAGEAIITAFETALAEKRAAGAVRGLRRRAHAGRHPVADAAAAHDGRGRPAARKPGLPYIVVLTNPTTGGVTASYAMLGDVHIAEPGALIGFAGPRVIEQTIREKLPEGFQRAEYLMEHGMVDMVVSRLEMKATIARLLQDPAARRRSTAAGRRPRSRRRPDRRAGQAP